MKLTYKSVIFIPLLILVAGLIGYNFHKFKTQPESELANALDVMAPKDQVALISGLQLDVDPNDPGQVSYPEPTENSKQGFYQVPLQAPRAQEIKADVAQDPHTTPKTLVKFSIQVGLKMKEALQDPKLGESLFSELSDCATKQNEDSNDTVKAFCLLNAKELSQKHNLLKERYNELWANVSPRIRELVGSFKPQ